ncbi:hypothetical protein HZH68_007945 [Vespula germanica]|uniref:Uncharacterized protein n=1 Tax=Vespula germanica TaxID=30212 RepID=A0A834K333_VESGE|nr:hypothetical protein HZH68_007945 [Vespula germanica]
MDEKEEVEVVEEVEVELKEVQRQDTFSEIISGLLLGKLDAELGSGGGRRAASPSAILGSINHHRWLRSSSKFSLKQSRRESIALCERRFEDYPTAGRRVELRKIFAIKGSPSFDVVSSSLLS